LDYSKLVDLIKQLSNNEDVELGDMRIDEKKIYIELNLIPKLIIKEE
jgi:hypothetical protein